MEDCFENNLEEHNCEGKEKAGPLTIYEGMVLRGDLHHDANQHKVAVALDELLGQLRKYELQMKSYHAILEVHQRIHKHWTQGRHRRPHNVQLGSNSFTDLSTLTLEDARKE